MSQNEKKLRRYLGKIKTTNGQHGTYQNIMMDNIDHLNKDGTPNQYYKGALIWADVETGKNYQVKQMSIYVPKNGMKAEEIQRGFSCFVTLDLENNYQVTVLG